MDDGMSGQLLDAKRLQHLWDHASKVLEAATQSWQEGRLQAGRDRVAYFEKLALFNGATIALVTSSLASGRIQVTHKYSLRGALISLVIAMCSAMARNWFYPYYSVVALGRIRAERVREKEAARINYVKIFPTARDIETGELFDTREAVESFEQSDAGNAKAVRDAKKLEKRLQNKYQACEWTKHLTTITGIGLLTTVAILTF